MRALRRLLFVGTPLEGLLLAIARGRTTEGLCGKLLPTHDLFPNPSLRKLRRNGHTLTLNVGEWMEWAVYFDLKDPTIDALISLLRPGETVLDVGTNIGSMLTAMARAVGPQGQAYGFEPSRSRFEKCQQRLVFEDLKNAHVAQLALGPSKSHVTIHDIDSRNLGRSQISETKDGVDSVLCLSMDDWLSQRGLKQVHLIKIDVEGFETRVVQGMSQTLKHFRPLLFIEVDDGNLRSYGSSAAELLGLVRSHGYRTYSVAGVEFSDSPLGHLDIIARPHS